MKVNNHNQKVNLWRFFIDLFSVLFAWILSFLLRFDTGLIAMPKGDDKFLNYLILAPTMLFAYGITFVASGLYVRALIKRRIWAEHFDIIRTHFYSFLIFVTLNYFVFDHRYSRITLFIFFLITPLVIAMGRSVIRKINRHVLRKNKPNNRAIIVGSGEVAQNLAQQIRERRDWDTELVGQFAAADSDKVQSFLQSKDIAIVFVAASATESVHLQQIYNNIGNTMAEIILIPDLGVPTFLAPKVVYIDNIPAVAINTSPLNNFGCIQKRIFDIIASVFFIICFSPVFLICALLVKLSSKGPILYKQERMGLDGKEFYCLKFRGMYVNAENNSGPVWATANDSRTTTIGKILRKTSLDEIPQFFNVLKGDMSIVGPRPERPYFVEQFRHQIPGYMLRHKSKAGITGWAQINGWRGNTSLEKRIEFDLWYLQHWSLWLDIKICLWTPIRGLIHPNAY